MKFFLFNEIVPANSSDVEFSKGLENSLKEYKFLKEEFQDEIDGIVTSAILEKINLKENITLASALKGVEDVDVRNYGYSVLTKFPIEAYLSTETTLEAGVEHSILLDNIEKDAFFLKILYDIKGVSFSLNLHSDLSRDELSIYSKDKKNNYSINNLYGLRANTIYIKELIAQEVYSKLGNFDRLLKILDGPVFSSKFELGFKKESREVQDAIIKGFKTVLENRKLNINSHETLLKDVTPSKETRFKVKELKTRDPRAKRVYFSVVDSKYYLASLEDKPLKDKKTREQDSHIKNAYSKLKGWLDDV